MPHLPGGGQALRLEGVVAPHAHGAVRAARQQRGRVHRIQVPHGVHVAGAGRRCGTRGSACHKSLIRSSAAGPARRWRMPAEGPVRAAEPAAGAGCALRGAPAGGPAGGTIGHVEGVSRAQGDGRIGPVLARPQYGPGELGHLGAPAQVSPGCPQLPVGACRRHELGWSMRSKSVTACLAGRSGHTEAATWMWPSVLLVTSSLRKGCHSTAVVPSSPGCRISAR